MPSDYWKENRERRRKARRGLYECLCTGRKLYPEQQTCPSCGRQNPQAVQPKEEDNEC